MPYIDGEYGITHIAPDFKPEPQKDWQAEALAARITEEAYCRERRWTPDGLAAAKACGFPTGRVERTPLPGSWEFRVAVWLRRQELVEWEDRMRRVAATLPKPQK